MAKRFGPEPRPESDLRKYRVGFYVTESELARLIDLSGAHGKDGAALRRHLSRYVRDRALHCRLRPTIPEINREAWSALARAAANLNQIAHKLNTDARALSLDEVRKALHEFRLALICQKGGKDHEQDQQ